MSVFRGFQPDLRQVIASGRADTSRLTCRAAPDSSADLCGAAATWMVTAGCPHEHIVPSLACDKHAGKARTLDATGPVLCVPCKTGPQSHRCRVLLEFTPLRGQDGDAR